MGGPMICPLMGPDTDVRVYAASGGTRKITDEEQKANARLIAAAPDLLVVCQEFVAFTATEEGDREERIAKTNDLIIRMSMAIARTADDRIP
jgi:hypothetical protein